MCACASVTQLRCKLPTPLLLDKDFMSAEDAHYVWSPAELRSALLQMCVGPVSATGSIPSAQHDSCSIFTQS